MKWYIPREHGAWAMVIVPYWLGAGMTGVTFNHIIFFIGLFSLYFAQAPLLTYLRQPKHQDVWPSFFIYVTFGSFFLVPNFIVDLSLFYIALIIFPFFFINLVFAKLKKERLFLNDLSAIIALSAFLLFSYQIGNNTLLLEAFYYMFVVVAFFVGSVFHVKSLLREKGNITFRRISVLYHIGMVVIMFVFVSTGAGVAFLISLVKTVAMPKKYLKKPIQIGIVEIINSSFFIIAVLFSYYG
ncbi:YwiC-like family protein [Salipaludibacillus daqingensis]|uniref:YwiC-like family protein n=1 Tax=Salipaludibacillus daqingensis TaxID=3041001 RepID=UPI002474E599|nr:YwiC-like family protein [Salipaludibacillus daqingensis]